MSFGEFLGYKSEYKKGIKKISYYTSRYKLVKESNESVLEKSDISYDLFFNKKGVLLHSVHTRRRKSKVIYCYNKNGILQTTICLESETNKLLYITDYYYDEEGRIANEECRSFHDYGEIVTEERTHTYTGNSELMVISSDNEEEDEYRFYFTYDEKRNIIEEKVIRNEDELVWWNKNEYDGDGNQIKQFSLDNDGNTDGVYEYLPVMDGLTSGYHFKSIDKNYLREYSYTFNERRDWINQVMKNDGEPRYVYERSIEYY